MTEPRTPARLEQQTLDGFPGEGEKLRAVIEAALFASHEPLRIEQLQALFRSGDSDSPAPDRATIQHCLDELVRECEGRGVELIRSGNGYRYRTRPELTAWLNRLWDEKPRRLSRALLETLALIAYRQPITRGEIEAVRGVSVASNLIRTLLEYEWVRVVGHRDVPGRPALFATTGAFLDTFGLTSVDELPPLSEIKSMAELEPELDLETGVASENAVDMSVDQAGEMATNDDLDLGDEWSTVDAVNSRIESAWHQTTEDDEQAGDTEPADPDTETAPESLSVSEAEDPAVTAGDQLTEAEKLAFIEERLQRQSELLNARTATTSDASDAGPGDTNHYEDDNDR